MRGNRSRRRGVVEAWRSIEATGGFTTGATELTEWDLFGVVRFRSWVSIDQAIRLQLHHDAPFGDDVELVTTIERNAVVKNRDLLLDDPPFPPLPLW
jgi:hypothetical protein